MFLKAQRMETRRSFLAVDIADYIDGLIKEPHTEMHLIRRRVSHTGKSWHIDRTQGRFLECLILAIAARHVVEVGTFYGYSTLWLAHAVGKEGKVTTIESDPIYARDAQATFDASPIGTRIQIRVGDGLSQLRLLAANSVDLIFLDARKAEYPDYLSEARSCCRIGGIIVADNTLYEGRVARDPEGRRQTRAIRAYNRDAFAAPDLVSTLVPLGDGMTVSVRR
jgi:predicted O-methyltransferase YrrM